MTCVDDDGDDDGDPLNLPNLTQTRIRFGIQRIATYHSYQKQMKEDKAARDEEYRQAQESLMRSAARTEKRAAEIRRATNGTVAMEAQDAGKNKPSFMIDFEDRGARFKSNPSRSTIWRQKAEHF